MPLTCEVSRWPENDLADVVFFPLMLTTDGAAFCTARTTGEYLLGRSCAIVEATNSNAGNTADNLTNCFK